MPGPQNLASRRGRHRTQLASVANLADPASASIEPSESDRLAPRPNVTEASERAKGKPRAARRKLTTRDYQALGAFRHALRKFLAFSEAGSDAMGLTPQQHQALLAVRSHTGTEAMTVGELAQCLLIRNHSALGLAERLIERGLMARAPSPQDRRRVLLYLTHDGAQHLEQISRSNLGQLKSTFPVFSELLRALEQLELPTPPVETGGDGRNQSKPPS